MATGRQAFSGTTTAIIHDAILNRPPTSPMQLNPALPLELERIINKALEKDREVRCQTASELRADLKRLKRDTDSEPSGSAGTVRGPSLQRRSRLLVMIGGMALMIIMGGTGLFLRRKSERPTGPVRTVPFSGLSGLEDHGSISPDGNQLSYSWNGGTGTIRHIYVKLIGAGTPLELTNGYLSDGSPSWSPDGRYIAFIRYSPLGKSEVVSIPALGGPERHLGQVHPDAYYRGATWSPDGKSILVSELTGLFLLSLENGEKQRITSPSRGAGDSDPAFSPDGQTLAFVRALRSGAKDIYLQNFASGAEARELTFDGVDISGLAWTPDGRSIVFSSERSGLGTLWKITASGGQIEALAGIGGGTFPAISRRGKLLAYTSSTGNVNIWRIPVTRSARLAGPPVKLISGPMQRDSGQFYPDGKRIVFSSDRSGNFEIWVCNSDGSNAVQLSSFGGPITGSPRWSPDGRWIAFDSRPGGRGGVFVVDPEVGTPRRLTPPTTDDVVPSWSRDGKRIYFCSTRSGDSEIWKIPTEGGDAVQVTKTGGFEAVESNDGKWLYFSRYDKPGIWKMPVEGGAETLVLDRMTYRFWALIGQYLYFMDFEAKPHTMINRLDLASGKIIRMAEVEKDQPGGVTGLSISPGGEWIIYPQVDEANSQIMLVENFH